MAPKKSLPLPPPSPEPEEEEEETEEEEEEEEELDEEGDEESDVIKNEIATPEKNSFQVNKNRKEEIEEEDDEEEEEEDEEEPDSPTSPNVSDFTIKPISQKKRPSSSLSTQKDDEKASKNSKKIKTSKGEEKKENGLAASASGGAGRVWSLDDQIALLQGMIDYQNKYGSDPLSDRDALHKFIKKKLRAEISKNQMYDKVRRLKKKYEEKAEGDDLAFLKPYDLKLFDLSKKIWGKVDGKKDKKNGNTNGNVKESKKDDLVMDDASDEDDLDRDDDNGEEVDLARGDMIDEGGGFQSKYPNLVQSFDLDAPSHFPPSVISFVKEGLDAIGSVKARELEEKWKKIRLQEAELYVQKLDMMKTVMKEYIQLGKNGKNVRRL